MAKYDRRCNDCTTTWEVECKISEKDNLKPNCPTCNSIRGEWVILSSPTLASSDRLGNMDKKSGIDHVFKRIGNAFPGSELSKRN